QSEPDNSADDADLDLAEEHLPPTAPEAQPAEDWGSLDLAFDEESKDLSKAKGKDESITDSKRLPVPSDLDLSFDAAAEARQAKTEPKQTAKATKTASTSDSAISFSENDTSSLAAEEVVEVADDPNDSNNDLVAQALETADTPASSTRKILSDDELDSLFNDIDDNAETSVEPSPEVSSQTTHQPAAASHTVERLEEGADEDDAVEIEDDLDFDDEEFEEEFYTPLFSRPIIWVIGCALVVGAALIGFTMGGGPDTTPAINISGETATRLLNEQKAILVVKKPTHGALSSKHRKVFVGTLDEAGVKTDIQITSVKEDLVDLVLDITTPPPPKLTPKELVAGKDQPVWLNRFEIKRLEHYETFDTTDPSKSKYSIEKFSLRTKGRAYMRDHAGRGRRIVAPILIEGSLSADGSTIKGNWSIANGAPGEPVLPENSAKFLGGKAYRLFYSSPFRAKLMQNEDEEESNQDANADSSGEITQETEAPTDAEQKSSK
ncbi:MAG: hypothetical protein KDD66_17030, partial [Bdellovibrionales bacterium]|nr:hypothetical protein [Bdellovibrionales bacterium]